MVDQWYILNEMVKKTIESEDYKRLVDQEDIIAIDTSVSRKGAFPFTLKVHVLTDQKRIFLHVKIVVNGRWTNSIYEDESPRLLFNL